MSTIGKLGTKIINGAEIVFGTISTLQFSFRFELRKLPIRENENAPNYGIFVDNKDGVETQIGVAWKKQVQRGENTGEPFFALSFDDPSFNKPLSVAAFKDSKTGEWEIVYRRRQDQAA